MLGLSLLCSSFSHDPTFQEVPIWLNNVQCTGSETALDQCSFSGWGVDFCYGPEAGVFCFDGKTIRNENYLLRE